MMKEKIALLNISLDVPEDYIYIAKSAKMSGYNYIVKRSNFETLSSLFGKPDESEMVFEEDSEEWLILLFDMSSFEDFENAVIEYFGGEQNSVSMMAISNSGDTIKQSHEESSDVSAIIDYLATISDQQIKHAFFSIMVSLTLAEGQAPEIIDTLYNYIIDGLKDLAIRDLSATRVYLNDFMNKFAEVAKGETK